ncbi:hypothetical protein P9E34_19555 [Schinkia azotoformans]|uniref:hypothetical protein n=1 Tax=Schinkia azotoformans TaxID=1454 RepID=UPI002DBBA38D|nr:hypothetical protein [Schinkia azotoformans]MEC1726910.1 hypothetical protein [Schinkia azotoformans]
MGTIWRPTLRCDSAYRDYIEALYQVTSLDKNQIMRMMMFVSAHSEDFKFVISEYKKDGVTSLPYPEWETWEDAYWIKQTYKKISSDVTLTTIDIPMFTVKGNGSGIKVDLSSLL